MQRIPAHLPDWLYYLAKLILIQSGIIPNHLFLFQRAAGIRFPKPEGTREIAGYMTPKHAYEIAKIKQLDPGRKGESLESLTEFVMRKAYTMGIRVVRDLDPVDYREFLEHRKIRVDAYFKQLEDERLAKTLRTETGKK